MIDLYMRESVHVAFDLIERSEELELAPEFAWSGEQEMGLLSMPNRIPVVQLSRFPWLRRWLLSVRRSIRTF